MLFINNRKGYNKISYQFIFNIKMDKQKPTLLQIQCSKCSGITEQPAEFCKFCGHKFPTPISDEQYQEQNSKKQYPKNIRSQIKQIEERIDNLQKSISQHRGKQQDIKCWYFGIEGLIFDYGPGWSSCDYWRLLITSNQKICTDYMAFFTKQGHCSSCLEVINELQQNKAAWQKLIRNQYKFLNLKTKSQ